MWVAGWLRRTEEPQETTNAESGTVTVSTAPSAPHTALHSSITPRNRVTPFSVAAKRQAAFSASPISAL